MLKISSLITYPIKSLGGISLLNAELTDRGLKYDRRWMLVDDSGRFLSQRDIPNMALCKPQLTPEGIIVRYPHAKPLLIPFEMDVQDQIDVTIWDDTCRADIVCTEAADWFSKVLAKKCRLVYMPDNSVRNVDPEYAAEGKLTSFADAYPLLMIGERSISDLSSRTGIIIPMDRFRPNIVFSGGSPYAEDEMAHFQIRNMDFYGVKICARCPVPGVDQDTAIRTKEPLKTLATYRKRNNNVYLGQNLVHQGEGTLHVGDEIHLLSTRPAPIFDPAIDVR